MVAEAPPTSTVRPDGFDILWRILGGSFTRALLIVLLVISLLLGSLFPQLPSELVDDRVLADRWFSTALDRYGTWSATLRTVGLLDIGNSIWFRLLLAAVGLHLLLAVAETVAAGWAVLRRRGHRLPSGVNRSAITATLPPPLNQAVDSVAATLRSRGLRVLLPGDMSNTSTEGRLYGDRCRAGILGPVSGNVGGVLMIIGLFVNSALGWQTPDLTLAPGQDVSLQHGTDLRLRLDQAASGVEGGRISFLFGQTPAIEAPLYWNRPAEHRGTVVLQTGSGPALRLSAMDAAGRPLVLQEGGRPARESISLAFDQPQAERHVTIADQNLVLRVVAQPPPAGARPEVVTYVIQTYRGGSSELVSTDYVSESSILTKDQAEITFQPEQYAILRAGHSPGSPLLLSGAVLTLLGVIISLYIPVLSVEVDILPERRAVLVCVEGGYHGIDRTIEEELELLVASMGGADARRD